VRNLIEGSTMIATVKRILTKADPVKLVKHPTSLKIYGEKPDPGFDESVKARGIDEPIVVAADGKTIISGVRRRNAAIKAKLKEVPILVRQDLVDGLDIEEAIIEANRHNEQSMEAKAKAFARLKAIEEERAEKRQKAGLNRGNSPLGPKNHHGEQAKNPEKTGGRGKSSEIAAEQVGLSRKTAERAAVVVAKIDEAEAAGDAETAADLRETLETSVAAAHRKVTEQPKSQASIVKDEFDRVVIAELREQHGLNAVLKSLGNSLDKARREVKELATVKGGEWIEAQHIDGLLRDAKRAIQQAAFLCECPKCKGNFKSDCKRCEGTSFIPIRSKGVLSDAEKGWLGI